MFFPPSHLSNLPHPDKKKEIQKYEMESHFIFGPAQDYGQIKVF